MNLPKDEHNAWNPGLNSTIPQHLNNAITLFRPENSYISYDDALDASRFCGLSLEQMADLRPERMIVHELLLRVTADLSVPDGPDYEYLGLSLRGIVGKIHEGYITPALSVLEAEYSLMREQAFNMMLANLAGEDEESEKGFFAKLWSKEKPPQNREEADLARVDAWLAKAKTAQDDLKAAVYRSLAEIGTALISNQGQFGADNDLIARLGLRLFCQDYGPMAVRKMVLPIFNDAVAKEGFRLLPYQRKRVVMNTKGASAAGKSTIRPKQRELAEKLGIPWADFALISPDYWRKYLLDYESLAQDYKYAAMLTGQELAMIDLKFDRYMAEKAKRNELPHLLIDRFRFDSFMIDSAGDYQSTLLTRFGDTVFLFFIITPPHETVERAWQRGLVTQRYKAVDDLLYHNREAFIGIPKVFFSWARIKDKAIHFEFLDNDVPIDAPPRTIAFGSNNQMTILDPVALSNIDRFCDVNIDARKPGEVLLKQKLDYSFLRRCVENISQITMANFQTGGIYAKIKDGAWLSYDSDACPELFNTPMLEAMGWDATMSQHQSAKIDSTQAHKNTIGHWGDEIA